MSLTEVVNGKRDWAEVFLPAYLNRTLMASNLDMHMIGEVLEECGFSKEYGKELWFLGEPFCDHMRGQIEILSSGQGQGISIRSSEHMETITDFNLFFEKIREHWEL